MKAAIGFAWLMLFTRLPGAACSCATHQPVLACEIFHNTPIIFRGRVIDHNNDARLEFAQWTLYRFRVEEVFKGLPPATKEVFIDPDSFMMCYRSFSSDHDYLIYIYGSQLGQTFSSYYAGVKDRRSRDGSVKPLPPAWKDLPGVPVYYVGECSPSRIVEESDPDLAYLRLAAQGKLSTMGHVQGIAAQNAERSNSFRDFVPVAGATVTATNSNGIWSATTKADGSYLIDPIPPGDYNLAFRSTRFGAGEPRDPIVGVPPGGCVVLRVSFASNATISGAVHDARGRPAKGVRIEAGEVKEDGRIRVIPATWTNSAADGAFIVHNVPVGPVVIGANINSAPDASMPFDATYVPGASGVASARIFTLEPNQQLGGVVLKLPRPLPFARMFVDVLWPDGSAATGGARASADWRGSRSGSERAAKDGNRVTLNLALGRTYDVSVDWLSEKKRFVMLQGEASQPVVFTHDGQAVRLRLKEKLKN